MKQNELYSYVYDFVSQVLDNKTVFDSVKKIVLFGSVARGDFRKESDIDLFVDLKSLKKQKKVNSLIKKEVDKFEARSEKTWHLRGVDLPLKIVVGDLDQKRWKDLREEMLSYGKIIYGDWEISPDGLKHHLLITYDLKHLPQKKKMGFLRKMYGYSEEKKGKKYVQPGLLEELKGEKVSVNALLIWRSDFVKIKQLLKEYSVRYWLRDTWFK